VASPIYLNLDDSLEVPHFELLDVRPWGPALRYHGMRKLVDEFWRQIQPKVTPFVLYGSGDFHYLAGVLMRKVTEPVILISFDNHPDWDIRPPYWACGGWVNRALEMPNVTLASIWGCGNFELRFPSRLFANRKAFNSGKLQVNAWAERQPPAVAMRFNCMTRDNWKDRFEIFVKSLAGKALYVTVDLDCLEAGAMITNWENGLFTIANVAWALDQLHVRARVVGGDMCGAYSRPTYARWFQRLAGSWDHPKMPPVDMSVAQTTNLATIQTLWPHLAR
jgi:hypothetical protein